MKILIVKNPSTEEEDARAKFAEKHYDVLWQKL